MGVKKGSFLFFMCVLVAGVCGWALYQIIIQGAKEFLIVLSQYSLFGFQLTFLQDFYVQNSIVVLACILILLAVSGWGLQKALEEILD